MGVVWIPGDGASVPRPLVPGAVVLNPCECLPRVDSVKPQRTTQKLNKKKWMLGSPSSPAAHVHPCHLSSSLSEYTWAVTERMCW